MKFAVIKASDPDYRGEVEINTIEELITFFRDNKREEFYEGLIINEDWTGEGFGIHIWDDWL